MVGGSSRVFRQLLVVVVSVVVGDRRQVVDGYQCYQCYVSCQCYVLGGSIFVVGIAIGFAIGSDSHQSGQCCSRFGPSVFYTLVAPMLVEWNAPVPSSKNDGAAMLFFCVASRVRQRFSARDKDRQQQQDDIRLVAQTKIQNATEISQKMKHSSSWFM